MDIDAIDEVTNGKTSTAGVSNFHELDINTVFPNPDQPRKTFENIEDLAAAIKEHGQLQPIVVVERDGGYMIVAGERRYHATIYNQDLTIKANVIEADDNQVALMALVENVQREDLTPFERAMYVNDLLKSFSHAEIAEKIGKPLSYISKCISVMKLDRRILFRIRNNRDEVGIEILQELAGVKSDDMQVSLYDKKATRAEIREVKKKEKEEISPAKGKPFKYSYTALAEQAYQRGRDMRISDTENHLLVLTNHKDMEYGRTYKITIEEVKDV